MASRGYTGGAEGIIPGRKRHKPAYSPTWTVAAALRTPALCCGISSGGPLSDGTDVGGLVSRWRGGGSAVPQEGKERHTALSEYRGRTGVGRGGVERTIQDGRRDQSWIESEYEVSYKPGGVYSLLHRLGCSPKVPRGLHEKADVLAQKSWKKGGLVSPLPERE